MAHSTEYAGGSTKGFGRYLSQKASHTHSPDDGGADKVFDDIRDNQGPAEARSTSRGRQRPSY